MYIVGNESSLEVGLNMVYICAILVVIIIIIIFMPKMLTKSGYMKNHG